MTATVSRFRPRRPRQAADADASELRSLLQRRPDLLPDYLASRIVTSLDQREPSVAPWEFVQMSASQNKLVTRWLAKNSRMPLKAVQLWAELLDNTRMDGVVTLTREELAQTIEVKPAECSRIMGELQKFGAITVERKKVPGMKGPGAAEYRVNANIATRLTGAARDKAQAEAPKVIPFPVST